jgi:hypothetical protein
MEQMTELELLVQQNRLIKVINKLSEELNAINAELKRRIEASEKAD